MLSRANITTLQNALNCTERPRRRAPLDDLLILELEHCHGVRGSWRASGNHVVEVNSVATTGSWYSDSVASGDTALADGGFTLQVGSNAPLQ